MSADSTAVACAWCGATADPAPPTWSLSTTERGRPEGRADGPTVRVEWLCETCTRQNVRSIEGRLDAAWW